MPTTPRGYRYPGSPESEPPNGPLQIANLAADVDADVTDLERAVLLYGVNYGGTALDGTPIPATARRTRLRFTSTPSIATTGVGAFNVGFGFTFTKLIAVALWAGDNAESLGFIVPVVANHTPTSAHGQAYRTDGTFVPNGRRIRVELDVVGYNL